MPIICGMKEYIETLQAGGQPKPVRVWKREGGQTVVDVWPQVGWRPGEKGRAGQGGAVGDRAG